MNNETSTKIYYQDQDFFVEVSTIRKSFPSKREHIDYTTSVHNSFAKASEYVTENLLEKTLGVELREIN